MAKHPDMPEVVEELESAVERFAGWVGANPWLAGGIAVAVLATAGAIGGLSSRRASQEEAASDALDRVHAEYLREMGASPGAFEAPELANPKAAEEIRTRYAARYREVAESERGTAAATLALLEAGQLLEDAGRRDEIAALYDEAVKSAPNPALRGVALRRTAQLHEAAGRWAEAAAAHEAAAAIPEYPLRAWALADAARCRLAAGDRAGALALYDRLQSEAPNLPLPDDQAAALRELRASSEAAAQPPAQAPAAQAAEPGPGADAKPPTP